MAFQVEELSIELIEALVPLMPRIKQRDTLEDDAVLNAPRWSYPAMSSAGYATEGRRWRGRWSEGLVTMPLADAGLMHPQTPPIVGLNTNLWSQVCVNLVY
jgi:hypothetical protein